MPKDNNVDEYIDTAVQQIIALWEARHLDMADLADRSGVFDNVDAEVQAEIRQALREYINDACCACYSDGINYGRQN